MQDSQDSIQQDSLTHTFEMVFLVVVESLLTVLLRFDSKLRQRAYPLVVKDTLIVIRSYLPHDEIYVTFTFKGVLLDSQMPAHKERADVIVNAHSFEIINAIISDKDKTVEKLQFLGETEQVTLFKEFLLELSISSLINSLFSRFKKRQGRSATSSNATEVNANENNTNIDNTETGIEKSSHEQTDTKETDTKETGTEKTTTESLGEGNTSEQAKGKQESNKKSKPKPTYQEKCKELSELQETHRQLDIDYKRVATEVAELKSRQKFFSILAVVGLMLGLVIGYLLSYLF